MYRVNLLLEAFGPLFRAANTLKISPSLYEKIVSVIQSCYSKNGLFFHLCKGEKTGEVVKFVALISVPKALL